MDLNTLVQNASATLVAVGWKVLGAFLLWLAGRWLISIALSLVGRAMAQHTLDATLTRYLQTIDSRAAPSYAGSGVQTAPAGSREGPSPRS